MAKKRDRRVGLSSNQQHNRVEASANDDRSDDSVHSKTNQDRRRIIILVLFFIVSSIISILVYRTIQVPSTNPSLPYVYQRGLVESNANYKEILTENTKVSENTSTRHFTHPVLAYITPWNSRGYELAKTFNSKFTHISPVWYDLKSQGTKLVLEGRHNADVGWISDLRMKGEAQILPRVVLEAIPMDLLKKKKQRDKTINLIVAECKEMNYDGIVIESWSRWAAYGVLHDPDMRNLALKFIKQLGQAMHAVNIERKNRKQSLQLVYVIGPPHSANLQEHDFGPHDLQSLIDDVDGFSLMTYDFSGPQNPGPNSPLKWLRSTLQILLGPNNIAASKIFVGINFYGNDFIASGGGGAIVAREYLSLLEKHKPKLHWEKNSAEHYFLYSDTQNVKHVVFYPSLMSIAMRLDEARAWGVGISIWEIGQGLDYFFDIF